MGAAFLKYSATKQAFQFIENVLLSCKIELQLATKRMAKFLKREDLWLLAYWPSPKAPTMVVGAGRDPEKFGQSCHKRSKTRSIGQGLLTSNRPKAQLTEDQRFGRRSGPPNLRTLPKIFNRTEGIGYENTEMGMRSKANT